MNNVLSWLRQRLSKLPGNSKPSAGAARRGTELRPADADGVSVNRPSLPREGGGERVARDDANEPNYDSCEEYEPTVPDLTILDNHRGENDEVPGYDPYDTVSLPVKPEQK